MLSCDKENNKARLRMPVRLGVRRNTMGPSYKGGTALHATLPEPRHTVKTPLGPKLLAMPTKRSILGQCLTNSPSCIIGAVSSQAKEQVPRKIPRPIVNTRAVRALVVPNTKQHLSKATNLKPLTSSPLVPLEEYENHHQSNIGIFNDFEKFRSLPEVSLATEQVPCLQFGVPFAEGRATVCAEKRKSNSASEYKKKSALKMTGVKKVSEIWDQPSRLGQTLISIPMSPNIIFSTRKNPLKISSLTPNTIKKEQSGLSSKSSVLGNPSVYKTYTANLSSVHDHKSAPHPPNSPLMQLNDTFSIEKRCNDENTVSHVGDCIKRDKQCKVGLTNNAQTCSSFKPKLLEDYKPIESQTYQSSCDLHSMRASVDPVLEMEQKRLSLLQEQYDLHEQQVNLQTQLSVLQQKQSNCLKKMMELQQESIKFLQGQSASPTQVRASIVSKVTSIAPTPTPIIESPVFNRRRSARLAIQSGCEQEASPLIATTNSVPDTDAQCSLTKDMPTDRSNKARHSGSTKTGSRRKSVVDLYGGLRSTYKYLLQTPMGTPGPGRSTGKSLKKVQFSVQDTPARLTSNVMKQLNTLYDL